MELKTSVKAVENDDGVYVFQLHAQLDLTEEEHQVLGKYQGGVSQLLPLEDWEGVLRNTLNGITAYDGHKDLFVPAKADYLENLVDGVTFRSTKIRQISELEDDLASIVIDTQESMDRIKRYLESI